MRALTAAAAAHRADGAPSGVRVGVVHAPWAAASVSDIVRAARGWCDVVLLFRNCVAKRYPGLIAMAKSLVEVAVADDDDLTTSVKDLALSGLTTFHDDELDVTDAARAEFGLPGAVPPLRWDKLVQREVLAADGACRVRATPVESPDDLESGATALGMPGVLKPRRGTSSVGISFVTDRARIEREIASRRNWDGLMYEQFIPPGSHPSGAGWLADYVSVETVSDGTTHHHVSVFDKLPISVAEHPRSLRPFDVRETGDVVPSRLPRPALASVLAVATKALDALGIRWRVSHTELRVSPDGIEIIEVNGRLGGEVARLLNLLGGPDLVAADLSVALGRKPIFTGLPPGPYAGAVYVPFPVRAGDVNSDVRRALIRRLPGVIGVDEVAHRGTPRAATQYRTARLSVYGNHQIAFDRSLAGIADGLASLFAADGLADDPWLGLLRRRLHDDLSR